MKAATSRKGIAPRWALTAVCWLSVLATAAGADWYVSGGDDGSAGTSWPTAFKTLQAALGAAASNDTIHVAGQTFALDAALSWTTAGITVRGGYHVSAHPTRKLNQRSEKID